MAPVSAGGGRVQVSRTQGVVGLFIIIGICVLAYHMFWAGHSQPCVNTGPTAVILNGKNTAVSNVYSCPGQNSQITLHNGTTVVAGPG